MVFDNSEVDSYGATTLVEEVTQGLGSILEVDDTLHLQALCCVEIQAGRHMNSSPSAELHWPMTLNPVAPQGQANHAGITTSPRQRRINSATSKPSRVAHTHTRKQYYTPLCRATSTPKSNAFNIALAAVFREVRPDRSWPTVGERPSRTSQRTAQQAMRSFPK